MSCNWQRPGGRRVNGHLIDDYNNHEDNEDDDEENYDDNTAETRDHAHLILSSSLTSFL